MTPLEIVNELFSADGKAKMYANTQAKWVKLLRQALSTPADTGDVVARLREAFNAGWDARGDYGLDRADYDQVRDGEWERVAARLSHPIIAALTQPANSDAEEMRTTVDYLFDTGNGCDGTARIIDLCFTAFMSRSKPNDEDGGPRDWFTDTKPSIDRQIAKMKDRVLVALRQPNAGGE